MILAFYKPTIVILFFPSQFIYKFIFFAIYWIFSYCYDDILDYRTYVNFDFSLAIIFFKD